MLNGAEDPRDTFAIRQEADALSQDGAESDFEWISRLREHFTDATALAEAEARGRRQGLEEAAKAAEVAWGHRASHHIRSLATTPAETQTSDA